MYMKQTLLHLAATILFALLGAIYELFSHEVYSYHMLFAFAIPLVLGALPCCILSVKRHKNPKGKVIHRRVFFFWNCGILVLTIGCAFQGVLDIYGTRNHLIIFYPIAGTVLLITGILMFFMTGRKRPCVHPLSHQY